MAVFDDGAGPALYIGGYFHHVGGVAARFLARWDGVRWSEVGGGVDSTVTALTIHDDGTGPALYAGGRLKNAGGVTVSHVAKWDGNAWSPVGNGIKDSDETVLALASVPGPDGATLYVSGYFRYAGGQLVEGIAQLSDGSWIGMGGTSGAVYTLAAYDDGTGPSLYAGGTFIYIGGREAHGFAQWNGSKWLPMGLEPQYATVLGLAVHDDGTGLALYVGGGWDSAGGIPIRGLVRWNGKEYAPVGDANNIGVDALGAYRDAQLSFLLVGGGFTELGGVPADNLGIWDGHAWQAPMPGCGFYVWALAAHDFDGSGPTICVGGSFDEAGGLYSPNLAMVRCIPVCKADCDGSGALDLADFTCFQGAFVAGDMKADCDASASLDLFDFLCFINAFNAGC
jgi:hypothetical protein